MKTPRAVRHVTEKLRNHLEKIPVINIELEVNTGDAVSRQRFVKCTLRSAGVEQSRLCTAPPGGQGIEPFW